MEKKINNKNAKNKKSNIKFLLENIDKLTDNKEIFLYSILEKLCESIEFEKKYCPVCNNSSDFFLPYGKKVRTNALCPYCNSLERDRLIYLFLKNKTRIFERKGNLLYLKPETSLNNLFKTQTNLEYISVDIVSRPNIDKKIKMTNIPFNENTFEIILTTHNELFIDNLKSCKELYKILKYNGKLIFTGSSERDFEIKLNKLNDVGFSIKEYSITDIIPNQQVNKYSISNEPIFVCIKK